MIQAEEVSLSFQGVLLFDEVNFTLNRGERCGLVGRNGTGKTTLLRLLMGQEQPDSGSICFSKGYRLGYLDQHIRFRCPTLLQEACLGLPEAMQDCQYLAETMLSGLGFQESDFELPPNHFSGGYQLRLHLAKVLLSEPDCLLLDEPTNYLDILSLRFLMRFLKEWQGELILISHDREFMDQVITHTLGIHRKKVRKTRGTTAEYFQQVLSYEEQYEKTRIKQQKQREHLQSYIDRFGAKASKAAQAQSRKKQLERMPALEALKSLYELNFNFHETPFYGRRLLEAQDVTFGYDKAHPLIRHFSLLIEKGERIAIIGKNGYGKSTLLQLLAHELKADEGQIESAEKMALGYFGQTHIQRLNLDHTIEEELSSANPLLPYAQIKAIAGQMMFSGDSAKKKIAVLSGGERSRVLLGKILAKPCNLLFLDEPTHHLDVESIEALIDALEEFSGSFVIVTHSELILKRLNLDKLIICHLDHQELFLGSYEEFLEKQGWQEEGSMTKRPPADNSIQKTPPQEKKSSPNALKALQKEIQKIETEILTLQQKSDAIDIELSYACEKKESETLQKLTLQREAIQHQLQTQYQTLELNELKLKEMSD